jgi:hypothetical protein
MCKKMYIITGVLLVATIVLSGVAIMENIEMQKLNKQVEQNKIELSILGDKISLIQQYQNINTELWDKQLTINEGFLKLLRI